MPSSKHVIHCRRGVYFYLSSINLIYCCIQLNALHLTKHLYVTCAHTPAHMHTHLSTPAYTTSCLSLYNFPPYPTLRSYVSINASSSSLCDNFNNFPHKASVFNAQERTRLLQDATGHDWARLGTTGHDRARPDTTRHDQTRPDTTRPDLNKQEFFLFFQTLNSLNSLNSNNIFRSRF